MNASSQTHLTLKTINLNIRGSNRFSHYVKLKIIKIKPIVIFTATIARVGNYKPPTLRERINVNYY